MNRRRKRNGLMKMMCFVNRNRVKRICAGVMIFCLLAGLLPIGAYAGAPKVAVDETMYVNLDYYGAISEANVVKGTSLNGNKEYVDYGNYEKVTNMTNTIAPVVKDGKVQWNLGEMDKERFYFQGTLKNNNVVLPWKLDISYKLNGVPTRAEKLAGASGLVEINIKAVPNRAASQYYQSNMLLTATTLINMEDSYSIEAPGAQLQSMGTYKAVVFAAMPGEEKTFTIRVGSDSFESSGVTMAMLPGTLEQLKDIKDLNEAKDKVRDSADAIYDSMNSMLGTFESMTASLTTLQSGLYDFEKARKTINSSKGEVNDKGDLARAELPRLTQQLNAMIPYMKTGQEFIKTVNGKVYGIVDNVAGTKTTLSQFSTSINTIQGDLTDFRNMVKDLEDKNDQRLEMMDKLDSDVKGLDSLIKLYESNLAELKNSQAGLKTALATQLPGMSGITPETLLALNNFLTTTDHAITNLQYTIAAGKQLSSSMQDTLSVTRDYLAIIDSHSDTADSLLKESIRLGDTTAETIQKANDLIDKMVDLNNTMNSYEADSLNLLAETERMIVLTSASLTSVNNYLDSLQGMMDKSGDYMEPGTRKAIQGMIELAKRSLVGIKTLPTIRRANDTIKSTVNKELDKFEVENKFLNLDAEAPLVSFTSSKNTAPVSTQIVLRSKEISIDSLDNNRDLEKNAQDPGVFARLKQVFDKLWNWLFH